MVGSFNEYVQRNGVFVNVSWAANSCGQRKMSNKIWQMSGQKYASLNVLSVQTQYIVDERKKLLREI